MVPGSMHKFLIRSLGVCRLILLPSGSQRQTKKFSEKDKSQGHYSGSVMQARQGNSEDAVFLVLLWTTSNQNWDELWFCHFESRLNLWVYAEVMLSKHLSNLLQMSPQSMEMFLFRWDSIRSFLLMQHKLFNSPFHCFFSKSILFSLSSPTIFSVSSHQT